MCLICLFICASSSMFIHVPLLSVLLSIYPLFLPPYMPIHLSTPLPVYPCPSPAPLSLHECYLSVPCIPSVHPCALPLLSLCLPRTLPSLLSPCLYYPHFPPHPLCSKHPCLCHFSDTLGLVAPQGLCTALAVSSAWNPLPSGCHVAPPSPPFSLRSNSGPFSVSSSLATHRTSPALFFSLAFNYAECVYVCVCIWLLLMCN